MSRSKNITLVSRTFNVTHANDPLTGDYITRDTRYLRLDQMISRVIGQNVRQGSNFRVVGFGVAMTGARDSNVGTGGTADLDEGGSALVQLDWVSTTSHKVKAWNAIKKRWMKWRRLMGGNGRFDDFTVGLNSPHIVDGDDWSTAYPFAEVIDTENGLAYNLDTVTGGADSPMVGLLDPSTEGLTSDGYLGAFHEYQSRMGYTFQQKDSEGNVIAYAKFPAKPAQDTESIALTCGIHPIPTGVNQAPDENAPYFQSSQMEWLPSDNHVNVMCGLLRVNSWILPLDTTTNIGDDLTLTVTVAVEGWSDLKA